MSNTVTELDPIATSVVTRVYRFNTVLVVEIVKAPSLPGCAKAKAEINKVKAKKKVLLSIIVLERNRGNNFISVTDFIFFFYCKMTTKKNSTAKVLVP
jgi:hypothetical protein